MEHIGLCYLYGPCLLVSTEGCSLLLRPNGLTEGLPAHLAARLEFGILRLLGFPALR